MEEGKEEERWRGEEWKKAIPHGVAFLLKVVMLFLMWAKMDSNHRRYKPADLQSAPFGHSGIRPCRNLQIIGV